MIPATFHPSVTHSRANPRRSMTRRSPSSVIVTRAVSPGRPGTRRANSGYATPSCGSMPWRRGRSRSRSTSSLRGREGGPLLQASGLVIDQSLFPGAEHRRVLEVLRLDGNFLVAFLVAADLGDLPVGAGPGPERCPPVVPAPTSASSRSRVGREAQTTASASPGRPRGRFRAPRRTFLADTSRITCWRILFGSTPSPVSARAAAPSSSRTRPSSSPRPRPPRSPHAHLSGSAQAGPSRLIS